MSSGFEGEVCENDLEWLARRLNKDADNIARHLEVAHSDIDLIRQQGDRVERQNVEILHCWITETRNSGNIPTWKTIKDVLEKEDVRRFDVIRARLNEKEIPDCVFLWLEHRVAAFCVEYGRILDIPQHEIDMICSNIQSPKERCRDILKRWKEITRKPKIENLIEALEDVKKNETAKEMREKFLKDN